MNTAQAPQIIYDGTCGFCSTAARWLGGHIKDGTVTLIPSQELDESDLIARGVTRGEVDASVWWIDRSQRLSGHLAISAALRRCSGLWRAAGIAISTPPLRWFGPSVYRLVARYRHLLPGGSPSCAAPRDS